MKKSLIFALALVLLIVAGCSAAKVMDSEVPQQTVAETAQVQDNALPQRIDVDPAQFEAQMNGNYVILDVRSYEEFEEGFIEGAVLIPVDELESRYSEIEKYDKILVYCRSGNRSVTASQILLDNGFKEVYNLLGGIQAREEYKK